MQHDNSDDPYGFWKDEPTRQLKRTHGRTSVPSRTETRMVPVVRMDRTRQIPELRPRNPLVTRIGCDGRRDPAARTARAQPARRPVAGARRRDPRSRHGHGRQAAAAGADPGNHRTRQPTRRPRSPARPPFPRLPRRPRPPSLSPRRRPSHRHERPTKKAVPKSTTTVARPASVAPLNPPTRPRAL